MIQMGKYGNWHAAIWQNLASVKREANGISPLPFFLVQHMAIKLKATSSNELNKPEADITIFELDLFYNPNSNVTRTCSYILSMV